MDIFDETIAPLKTIWDDEHSRQQSKVLIMTAIGEATDMSVKEAQEVMTKMDDMLLVEKEDKESKQDPAR